MVQPFHSRAFTLIEMLVVLVIAGMFVALVSVIAHPDEKGLLRVEAERLAQLFDLAATESRLTGKMIRWTADASGYSFWRLRGEPGWAPVGADETLRARTLPGGMTISAVQVENVSRQPGAGLDFDAYGPPLSFNVAMSMGMQRYAVVGSPVGDVRVIAGEGPARADAAQR